VFIIIHSATEHKAAQFVHPIYLHQFKEFMKEQLAGTVPKHVPELIILMDND
tara:strand:- start:80 stop:235 length:156 start_codon:yes stop_codon:yes gene_type:complete